MTNSQTQSEMLSALQSEAESAAVKWIASMQESGAIERRVRDTLEERSDRVVLQLLGFELEWGGREWKVDHCNGRSGESAAGDWLRKRAGDAVRAWLDDQAGALPQLPKSAVADLRREYQQALHRALSIMLRRRAEVDAAAMVEGIVASATGGDA